MMRNIVLDGKRTNDYIRGRISGVVHILTGMPGKGYAWKVKMEDDLWTMSFNCDDKLFKTIVDVINEMYPDAIIGIETERSELEEES